MVWGGLVLPSWCIPCLVVRGRRLCRARPKWRGKCRSGGIVRWVLLLGAVFGMRVPGRCTKTAYDDTSAGEEQVKPAAKLTLCALSFC